MSIDIHEVNQAHPELSEREAPVASDALQTEQPTARQEQEDQPEQFAGTIKQKDLLAALSSAIKAASPRTTLPILGNVHIALRMGQEGEASGKATFTCTNLEISIRRDAQASVERAGDYTVPAKLLLECVKSIAAGAEIALSVEEKELLLKFGKRTIRVTGREADEFPSWPELGGEEGNCLDLAASELCQAIKETEFAAETDGSRPVLSGLYCECGTERITFVAADAFRLSIRVLPLPANPNRDANLLVPVTSMRVLAEVLPAIGRVSVRWDAKSALVEFRVGPIQMVSRLIEGTFPNFRFVVPKTSNTVATLERRALANALKGLAPFARDSSNITKITFTRPETVTILAAAEDVGSTNEDIDTPVEGTADGGIFLNYRYLSDILSKLREDSFTFGFTSGDKPIVIKPVGRDDFWYVVMPMSPNR